MFRILLVEDSRTQALFVRRMLEGQGFAVDSAGSIREAVERLTAASAPGGPPVDAVVLDVMLPDSYGFEGFARLRERFPEACIVLLTGLEDERLAMRAMGEGAQDYVLKNDLEGPRLARTLRLAIGRQRGQVERMARLVAEAGAAGSAARAGLGGSGLRPAPVGPLLAADPSPGASGGRAALGESLAAAGSLAPPVPVPPMPAAPPVSPVSPVPPIAPPPAEAGLAAQAPAPDASGGDLRPGDFLGHFRIISVLGRGGMGMVYEARNTLLDRGVALKLLSPKLAANREARERFFREAKAVARLDHPNVVGIYDVGEIEGRVALVMHLVRGVSAQDRLRMGGRFPWREATRVAAEACKGLAVAHAAGLVHRDIKPANIMIGTDGSVKLLDFGLAKFGPAAGETDDESHLTRTGMVVGTVLYMSPEQARGRPLDARSDIYSLGATYYTLLTDRLPFDGGSETIMAGHIHGDRPDPRLIDPKLPPAIAAAIARAMAIPPEDRHQSADALRADLERILATG